MTLQNILQTARLKLEHHPVGQQLMLLAFPFYARPHHFLNTQNSIIGRLGKFTPLVPAMLSLQLAKSGIDTAMHYYAIKQAITLPVQEAVVKASNTMPWLIMLGIMVFIFFIAAVEFSFNELRCGFWRKLGRQVKPAPYAFYLARFSSASLWFCFLMYAALYIFKFGFDRTAVFATQFINNFPTTVVFLLIGFYVLQNIKTSNSVSSSMEIYGSRNVVFINGVVSIVLCIATLYLLPVLFGYA